MKKKEGLFLGFAVLLLVAIFTMAGCATNGDSSDDGGTIYYQTYWNNEDNELNITFWGAENTREPLTDTQKAAVDALVPSDITIRNIGGGNLAGRGEQLYQNTRTDLYGKKLSTTGNKIGTNNKITITPKNGFTFAEYNTDNTF